MWNGWFFFARNTLHTGRGKTLRVRHAMDNIFVYLNTWHEQHGNGTNGDKIGNIRCEGEKEWHFRTRNQQDRLAMLNMGAEKIDEIYFGKSISKAVKSIVLNEVLTFHMKTMNMFFPHKCKCPARSLHKWNEDRLLPYSKSHTKAVPFHTYGLSRARTNGAMWNGF